MYRNFRSVSFKSLLCFFVAAPALMSGTHSEPSNNSPVTILYIPPAATLSDVAKTVAKEEVLIEADSVYDGMKLKKFGLTRRAFEYAWKGYKTLLKKGLVANTEVLSICDFSQSSRRKRLYVLDVRSKKVLVNTYVAHGRNSGAEYARSFSNAPESHKSSLGFYITSNTYYGDHGLALKIDGVERGINDNAFGRNIVVHGSKYIGDKFLKKNPFNGRSFGCPAIPAKNTPEVINTIKNGSCLFIYHPTKYYLTKSRILNG
jgi:hypothetical protein